MSIFLDIEKRFKGFNLKTCFEAGEETVGLLGASGCGKSMTLKCISGIEKPDKGKIIVDGETWFDSDRHINLKPQQRRTGFMFQNYALFPNMTVSRNILLGIRRDKNLSKSERLEKTRRIMETFDLTEHAEHLPAQLSGGQQQRTALARILVSDPHILLLDEPFSALDSHLRFRMEQEMSQVIRNFGHTVILVSHSRDEVFRLSDRVAIMNNGRVEVCAGRKEVFADPVTKNACILTGCKNISPIRKIDRHHVYATDWDLELETSREVTDESWIGIRHHETNGPVECNAFLCDVTDETENPFSYTIMLRKADSPDARSFGWELDKHEWNSIRAPRVMIHIPKESVLLLKD